ncbi:MAG TPA: 1-deoxy-D-xylulose-5-phosphate reductoisomerase [Thermohalobaculum sp.]|nr:1-deoxy-D-xylulose-5-phosphate reductoisomerase [Thermohalobaculum sp.]
MRRLSILGVSGSIGESTLRVIEAMEAARGGPAFEVVAVTGNANVAALARAARRLRADIAVSADPDALPALREALAGSGVEAAAGGQALLEAAGRPADVVMSAIIGTAGLAPTLAAVRAGADILLANKECLVAAGALFLDEIGRAGGRLLPVDSEHNALFQILSGHEGAEIERLVLTASGGPFRTMSRERMRRVTPAEARAHPSWSMGERITIDSATLFNKALEMIEAWHLFDVPPERIEVVVHPQSVVHALVGLVDGSMLAHLGPPDMAVAIGHALAYPGRVPLPVDRLDLAALGQLAFEPPDPGRFPALRLAREAMAAGGVAPCVMNGAKEIALGAFIAGRVGFLEIAEVAEATMAHLADLAPATDLEAVFAADAEARRVAADLVRARAA